MNIDLVCARGPAEFRVGLGLLDDHLDLSPRNLALPRGERARARGGCVLSGRSTDRLRHPLPGRRRRFRAEMDGARDIAVGEGLREELRVGELADIVRPVGDHGEPFHPETEVHHRHADPVLRERRGRVDAERGDLDPVEDRVAGVDLGLCPGHVVLRPLLVGLEPELGEPEGREEGLADGFPLFEGDVLPRDDAGGRVVGHQAGRPLLLLPPETAVHREEPDRQMSLLPDGRERQEPAARHVAPEGVARRLGGERAELGEDRVEDVHHGGIVGLEDGRKLVRQVVAVDRPLLVAVKGFAESLLDRGRDRAAEDRLDPLDLLSCNPDIRAGQAAEVEDPVEDGHRFGPELPVDIRFLDDQGVHRLVKPHREVGLAEPLRDLKYRVRRGPGVLQTGILARDPRRGQHRRPFVPGVLEVLSRSLFELFHIESHIFRSRQTTRLAGLSSFTV
ncbi:MAG: hypothetical protein BWX50_01252 [Euryarchaeota archaeon ADurb.Bin009]|nr:MAG: hypothetical protein BWX50_01252 [Euryarchaeota archaeon ADurb.Bin009]